MQKIFACFHLDWATDPNSYLKSIGIISYFIGQGVCMPLLNEPELLKIASKLPMISSIAIKIISLIDNPNTSREQIVDLVKSDKVVFAECFKQANSVAVASLRQYKNLNEVVDVLGFNHIKKVCIFLAAKSIIDDPKVWFESVFTAVAANYLAKKSGMDTFEADRIYMAALLLNYGSYVLNQAFPNLYTKVKALSDYQLKLDAEREEFGMTHPEISALLFEKYNVPRYITEIIENQKNIYGDANEYDKNNMLIEIGRVLSGIQDLDFDSIRANLDLDLIQRQVERFSINTEDFDENSLERIKTETQEVSYRK